MRFLAAVLALATLAVCTAAPATINADNVAQEFHTRTQFAVFKQKFNKAYGSVEHEEYRYNLFRETLERIEKKNKINGEKAFGINQFSDLHPAEFKRTYLNYRPPTGQAAVDRLSTPVKPVVKAAPSAFDWRKKGAVTPVKDQGQCGSCWAFSVTEATESSWFLAGNELPVLAPQQIVSCDTKSSDMGCSGGDPIAAYTYLEANGLQSEKSYPYTSGASGDSGSCSYNAANVVARVANYTYATPPCTDSCTHQDEATLAANVATYGPASICVAADTWQDYTGGIIRDSCASDYQSLDHCVQLVGLAKSGSDSYWLVRNSWADTWGEQGYIYLLFGKNLCGIADEATIVDVASN